jgi:nucleoside-diphosphate-sugar epimerase
MDVSRDKSALVTGGRGFIGGVVVKLLQCAGYHVVSLDQCRPVTTSQSDADEVVCDISDAEQLQRVFEGRTIGGIVHQRRFCRRSRSANRCVRPRSMSLAVSMCWKLRAGSAYGELCSGAR